MALAHTVESFLADRHALYATRAHRHSTSSLGTAHSAHVDEGCVAKSVLLEDEKGFVLAVLPASRRLELDRVRQELGRSLHLSAESKIASLFSDCEVGAVPPVGAAYGITTILDASLEDRSEVFFEGGDHETLVQVAGDTFLDLLENAAVAEIASEPIGLQAARALREKLYDSLQSLGRAITAPVTSGARWRSRVSSELARVSRALDAHVAETEGVDGILREIVEQAPRLWRDVDALYDDHGALTDAVSEVERSLAEGASSRAIRREVHLLIGRMEAHRHRGADLVYEAFGVDLGGG